MKIDISVPEVVELFNEIQETPEKLFEMMRLDIQEMAGTYLTSLMEAELTDHLGRDRYERSEGSANHRNGSYHRKYVIKGIGEVETRVPRDRRNTFHTSVLPRGKQFEAVEKWRNRDLSGESVKYLFVDGVNFSMRIEGSVEKVPVLVVIGVSRIAKPEASHS